MICFRAKNNYVKLGICFLFNTSGVNKVGRLGVMIFIKFRWFASVNKISYAKADLEDLLFKQAGLE